MEKRVIVVFCSMILMFTGVFYRTFALSAGTGLAQVAREQSTYTLMVAKQRGLIYDCHLKPMVNTQKEYRTAILPGPAAAPVMQKLIPDKAEFLRLLEEKKPFVLPVRAEGNDGYTQGIEVFEVSRRYAWRQSAVHIIGHLREGEGVYGLEQAYNDFLQENGSSIQVQYSVDATGRALSGEPPVIHATGTENRRGLVLTLDDELQRVVQQSAKKYISKGAVVVMDCATGDIKASISLPEFDPNNLTRSFEQKDTPFVNKAFAAFNVGSTFKLTVIAAALENGITPGAFECTGSIDVGGQIFKCNNHAGHGWVDLERGLEVSCNPYFIHLAQQVGAQKMRDIAQRLGFGSPSILGTGYQSAAGNLPELAELQNPADVANFGFGQGVLMATPLQLARMVSCIANGGTLVSPRLVQGYSNAEGTALETEEPMFAANRVLSEATAQQLCELMIAVVEEGSGKKAKPLAGGAGGKTASAQTGQYYDTAKTDEIVEAWFVGFFPAERPRYTIVVLAQGADSGSTYAAPVFKDIADGIIKGGIW